MNRSSQRMEIPLNKTKTAFLELIWLGLAIGAFYLAVKSLDPFFWQTIHINVAGTTWFMRQLPVPARVGTMGAIGFTLLTLTIVTLQRLFSNAPALIMDSDGIEGFKSGISSKTVRMRWDEIGDIKSYYGNLFIYSKRESMFAKRKLIAVQSSSVGKSGDDIVATMQAYMLTNRLVDLSGAQTATAPAPKTVYEPSLPTNAAAATIGTQPPLVSRPNSAMAGSGKASFGTRRNF